MNWDIFAAITGILGALGVIVTVIYLAIQIKDNTASVEGSIGQSQMALEVETW